ncbi:MAG: hypothetical protein Q8R60_08870 [Mycobacteriales bacterium]|nr:hypothetical protein [Mycobacteriales bacterium]
MATASDDAQRATYARRLAELQSKAVARSERLAEHREALLAELERSGELTG